MFDITELREGGDGTGWHVPPPLPPPFPRSLARSRKPPCQRFCLRNAFSRQFVSPEAFTSLYAALPIGSRVSGCNHAHCQTRHRVSLPPT